MLLNCKQTSQLVSQALDRRLSLRERIAVRIHLCICKYCKRFRQQLLAMRNGLRRMTETIEQDTEIRMPSESKARIAKVLDTELK